MPIIIKLREQTFELPHRTTVQQMFIVLKLSPETYLAVRDGELLTEDQLIYPGQVIKLVPVISGGAV